MSDVVYAHIIKVVTVIEDPELEMEAPVSVNPDQHTLSLKATDSENCQFYEISDKDYTIILGGSAEVGRTVLNKEIPERLKASVTRLSNGEKFAITGSVFKIGKLNNYVDLCIAENPSISRIHAQIEYDDGQYYLVDKRAINKTYLNGDEEPVTAGRRYALNTGDNFKLADEGFVFQMDQW